MDGLLFGNESEANIIMQSRDPYKERKRHTSKKKKIHSQSVPPVII
jgi:hypothetical protein